MKATGRFGLGVAVATAVVAALAPLSTGSLAAGTGNWPMFDDGPAHNGNNRAETTLTTTNVSGLHVVHTYPGWTTPPGASYPRYQVVVGSLGYSVVSGKGGPNIQAFNLPSGTRAWHHPISITSTVWHFVPAVANGVLYVGGYDAMYAFNTTSGAAVWTTRVPIQSLFNETTVSGGIVYADTYDTETVYAFDASNGHVLWSRKPAGCCMVGAVTVSGGIAYAAQNGGLVAYNATTGASVFTTAAAGGADTVAVSGGVVFLQSANNLQAFNASTGALLWTAATDAGGSLSVTPAVDGSTVVVGTLHYLIAFAASSGARLWTLDTGSVETPSIANGVVYAGTGPLQAVNEANGEVLYTNGQGCDFAIVSHGEVFAQCVGGETVWSL
jgi:outer membrane protein assembly factor BamB